MDTNLSDLSGVLEQFIADAIAFIPDLNASLIIFVLRIYLAGLFSRLLVRWLKKREVDQELVKVLETVTRWSLYILGTTMALNQIGFNLTAFLTGLGILGFTVGFAIQDVSKNFIAGLLLLIEQPFDIGDTIEVKGFGGVILDVDLRATEMRTLDGRIVQIPNADVFTSPIINYSRAERRRLTLAVGVAYGSDLEQVRNEALSAIGSVTGVLEDPAPQVIYNNFGGTTIDFELRYWIDTVHTDYFTAQDNGYVALEQAFRAAGIDMPYPTQVVINK